jgi:hypothetical protein
MANTGKKMIARTPTRKPLSSRPIDLIYFIFFLVRVRVFITPLLSIHLPPYIAITHYTYIPLFRRNNMMIGEVVPSSFFCSFMMAAQLTDLVPFVSFPKKNKLENRFIYRPRCW